MRVVAVTPGLPGSAEIGQAKEPVVEDGQVGVRVLEVGVDGTDREIYHGHCGAAPAGEPRLVIGHECLGRVDDAGAEIEGIEAGDLVVPTVRRPCGDPCANCARGASDMCRTGRYSERGIERLHGYLAERFAEAPEYLVKVPARLAHVAVLLEPLSIVHKAIAQAVRIQCRLDWEPRSALVIGAGPIGLLAAISARRLGIETFVLDQVDSGHAKAAVARTAGAAYLRHDGGGLGPVRDWMGREPDLVIEASGHSPFVFEALRVLAINGIVAVVGASGQKRPATVPADELVLDLVLRNKTVFGCVNSNRTHFERSLGEMEDIEREWPGLLASLITRRLPLDRCRDALEGEEPGGIKTVVEVCSR